MNTAQNIAHYVLHLFQQSGESITNLKLQKLLYYIQGWHLGLYHESIFDEDFEAWIHGPVVPSVFQEFKANKWWPILEEANCTSLGNKAIEKHIDDVLEVFGACNAYELELMSHREMPWIKARNGIDPTAQSNAIITKASMEDFFSKRAKDVE